MEGNKKAMYPMLNSLDPSELNSVSLSLPELENSEESVQLLDDEENLLIASDEEFAQVLRIKDPLQKLKVVSIFGKTGDGKSYTLNQTFFRGREVFKTSGTETCTEGVWAKYEPTLNMICFDTTSSLTITSSDKEYKKIRLLLKIAAISDVVIYLTKSERLPRDMYSFLGLASTSYKKYFNAALQKVPLSYGKYAVSWGPNVIIFHETRHTKSLKSICGINKTSPEEIIRESFVTLDESCDGFSSLKYIDVDNESESFAKLKEAVRKELETYEVKSPRTVTYIYGSLKTLNENFQSRISDTKLNLSLSAVFPCQEKCLSCGVQCTLSEDHRTNKKHFSNVTCKLSDQHGNFIYLCRKCGDRGIRQIVKPQDQSWTNLVVTNLLNYTIECPNCGVIYKRELWYGNKDPTEEAVVAENVHVWAEE